MTDWYENISLSKTLLHCLHSTSSFYSLSQEHYMLVNGLLRLSFENYLLFVKLVVISILLALTLTKCWYIQRALKGRGARLTLLFFKILPPKFFVWYAVPMLTHKSFSKSNKMTSLRYLKVVSSKDMLKFGNFVSLAWYEHPLRKLLYFIIIASVSIKFGKDVENR